MGKITYYDILEVSQKATLEEIKQAYRKRAREAHPDLNKGIDSNKKMAWINKAYETLSDDTKRKSYDLRIPNPNIKQTKSSYSKEYSSKNYRQTNKNTRSSSGTNSSIAYCLICHKPLDAKWKTYCLQHYWEMKRNQNKNYSPGYKTNTNYSNNKNVNEKSWVMWLVENVWWIVLLVYIFYLVLK